MNFTILKNILKSKTSDNRNHVVELLRRNGLNYKQATDLENGKLKWDDFLDSQTKKER